MFITGRKGYARDGNNPTILYGYGGFNVSVTPTFSASNMAWLELGGLYAVANLRGGGEYGRAWHEGGMKTTKQNVFDDFAAAAEYLIAKKYTRASRLAISGRSNGGLLVAATMLQRPELFGAALPAVGVLYMLRFREFTIGWAWESDYGSVKSRDEFKALRAYSPAQHRDRRRISADADHDRRPRRPRLPRAQLQVRGRTAEGLPRRPPDAHPGGDARRPRSRQPTSTIIEEQADIFAF